MLTVEKDAGFDTLHTDLNHLRERMRKEIKHH
jgi:hypothetical protein